MTPALPLHVRTVGPPAGPETPTFVLLHGFGASAFTWRHWVPRLAQEGHVVLVDMKGFGAAPKPDDGAYAPADLADLVHRMLVERDLSRVTLVGHSLGGGVSLLTALRLLDDGDGRLERMILVAGAAYAQRLPPFVRLAEHPGLSASLFRLVGPRRVVRFVIRSIVYDPDAVTEEQVDGYATPLEDPASHAPLLWVGARVVPPDLERISARFAEIDVPTLLIWGRHDRVIPLWVGRRLSAVLPHSELVVFDRCGHVPPEELPEASLDAVVSFLGRTSPSAGSAAH